MFHDYREQAHQQLVKEFPGIAAEITSQRLELLHQGRFGYFRANI